MIVEERNHEKFPLVNPVGDECHVVRPRCMRRRVKLGAKRAAIWKANHCGPGADLGTIRLAADYDAPADERTIR